MNLRHLQCVAVVTLAFTAIPAPAETLQKVFAAPAGQRVYDFAGALPKASRASLRERLRKMAKSGLANGALVIVDRVDGDSVDRFAYRIRRRWRLGENSGENGFLILVAMSQRRWRLDTGAGLRNRIPDETAKALMQQTVVPAFRRKNYAEGLQSALNAIDQRLRSVAPAAGSGPRHSERAVGSTQPFGGFESFVFEDLVFYGGCFLLVVVIAVVGHLRSSGESSWFSRHHHSLSHYDSGSSFGGDSFNGGDGGSSDSGGGASGGW